MSFNVNFSHGIPRFSIGSNTSSHTKTSKDSNGRKVKTITSKIDGQKVKTTISKNSHGKKEIEVKAKKDGKKVTITKSGSHKRHIETKGHGSKVDKLEDVAKQAFKKAKHK